MRSEKFYMSVYTKAQIETYSQHILHSAIASLFERRPLLKMAPPFVCYIDVGMLYRNRFYVLQRYDILPIANTVAIGNRVLPLSRMESTFYHVLSATYRMLQKALCSGSCTLLSVLDASAECTVVSYSWDVTILLDDGLTVSKL